MKGVVCSEMPADIAWSNHWCPLCRHISVMGFPDHYLQAQRPDITHAHTGPFPGRESLFAWGRQREACVRSDAVGSPVNMKIMCHCLSVSHSSDSRLLPHRRQSPPQRQSSFASRRNLSKTETIKAPGHMIVYRKLRLLSQSIAPASKLPQQRIDSTATQYPNRVGGDNYASSSN